MDKKYRKHWEASAQEAEAAALDKNVTGRILDRAVAKIRENSDRIRAFSDELKSLIRLTRSWMQGDYPDLPWKTIVTALMAILYFLNPLDLIPDFIAFFGFLDDATILTLVLSSIRSDLKKFHAWETEQVKTVVLH